MSWSKEYLEMEQRIANRDYDYERKVDPRSTHRGPPYPWDQPTNAGPRPAAPNTAPSRRVTQPDESVCVDQLRSAHTERFKAELLTTLASRPSGLRIRYLRTVLGWNQRTAAAQLGISRRTLIRHEQGHHRTSSTRLSLLLRLLELEAAHSAQILAYVHSRTPSFVRQRPV
jgi:DNA-binding XRE family transcriptional regulator